MDSMLQCDVTSGNPSSYTVIWIVGFAGTDFEGQEIITITPTKADHEKVYTCVANNGLEATDPYALLVERKALYL